MEQLISYTLSPLALDTERQVPGCENPGFGSNKLVFYGNGGFKDADAFVTCPLNLDCKTYVYVIS